MTARSALGCVVRTVWRMGSRTGLPLRGPTEATKRARIRAAVASGGDVADALAVASERTSSLMN